MVKCDLCAKEFNNTEELMEHKEKVHPMDEGEVPEMKDENAEVEREKEESEVEVPTPGVRLR